MSGRSPVLELTPEDLRLMLAAQVFIGETSLNYQMSNYVHGRNAYHFHIIRLDKTWEKILLAARAIAAVDNPAEVCVIGARPFTQRAVLKFAHYTRTTAVAGRFTPGAFTNQRQSADSIAVCWWLLAREVRRIRGEDVRSQPWSVWPDLFLYRENISQEDAQENEEVRLDNVLTGPEYDTNENWGNNPALPVDTMGDIGISATGFGPTGGWNELDAGPAEGWSA